VNFFLQHRTCRGQRLRPLNEFVNNRADRNKCGHRLSKVDFETDAGLIIVSRRHCTWIRWNNAKEPLRRSRLFNVTDCDTNRLPVSD